VKAKINKIPRHGFLPNGRLEIFTDSHGVVVMGNRAGLISLAKLIEQVAAKPALYYQLVGLHWHFEVLKKKIIIGLGKQTYRPPTPRQAERGKDLRIMSTDKIGKRFWRSIKRRAPYKAR
jgi:hypothetical protein